MNQTEIAQHAHAVRMNFLDQNASLATESLEILRQMSVVMPRRHLHLFHGYTRKFERVASEFYEDLEHWNALNKARARATE